MTLLMLIDFQYLGSVPGASTEVEDVPTATTDCQQGKIPLHASSEVITTFKYEQCFL